MERLDRVTVPPPDTAATSAARQAGLGAYLRAFRARHGDIGSTPPTGSRERRAALVLATAAAGLAVPATVSRLTGPAFGVPLLLLAFAAAGLALWRALRSPGRTPEAGAGLRPAEYVYLYERGLVCPGPGGTARAVPWQAVTAMHQDVTRTGADGRYTGTHYAYRLLTGDGHGVAVGGFLNEETVPRPADSQIRELAQIVLDETVRRALPPAVTTLEAGGRVAFGEIAVDGRGIALPSGTAAWERVRLCEWRGDGLVVVRTAGAGRWAREAKDIPDFPVFWTLVKELFPEAREVRR
ncbi:DUF6585 family protein [Streptomyces sp. NPDC090025]|uniref:DUF6585 family protein n=1 Tax=Streptomyces sp. NPDC090025 TaxID=3365922 RepID=UPI003837F387